ncbi:DUF6168 family protein [Leeuwenhoekiella sp. A16]|uniref:DUF6168 family protein n=1 Tax=unclassified Leeuwenhoekiella TaxID=2615029 RepID=UPI003A80574B
MNKMLSLFLVVFGALLCLSFITHAGLLTNFFDSPVPPEILFSYKFNFGFTFMFTLTIIFLSKKVADQLGYIFLVGSGLKLVLFLILTKIKGFSVDKSVFLDFFIPYITCLTIELYIVAKILKNTKPSENQ